MKSVRERPRRFAGADDLLDDLQSTNEIRWPVRLAKPRVTIGSCQADLRYSARCVEDAQAALMMQPGGDLRAETSLGQPHIQDRQIGFVTYAELDRLLDSASYAAHLISALDERIFKHIAHEYVVLGDHDLEHRA
jgi:hypothetical protein